MDTEAAGPPLVIAGANELARAEISQVRVDRQGHLSVTDPSGKCIFGMADLGLQH